jgi:single-strand DNA-binding protein
MNVFTFTGNLGRDAEQRFTPSGDSVVTFSVPAKSGFGDKAITSWIKCALWGKRGDSVLPYLKKGQLVGVSGEFQCREYQDKDGQQRYSNEVRVNDVNLLGKRSESEDGYEQAPQRAAPKPAPSSPSFDDLGIDIPFVSTILDVSDTMGRPKSLRRARRGENMQGLSGDEATF